MKIRNSFFNVMLAVILLGGSVLAQEGEPASDAADTSSLPKFLDKVYLGAGLGSALSFTDVKQYPTGAPALKFRSELGYGFNGIIGYKLNSFLSAEATLSWVRLNGTDRTDNVWFTASLFQWDLGLRLNVANLVSKKTAATRKFDVNLLAGLGQTAFRARKHLLVQGFTSDPVIAVEGYEEGVFTKDDLDKKFRTLELSAYLGIGASYRFNDKIDIFLDLKGYYVNSDKLDATQSVNGSNNDKYTYNSIGIIYHLTGAKSVRSIDEESPESKIDSLLAKLEDVDNDGVPNYLDKDPNTPAGVAVNTDGTSMDTDGDGVADHLDQEKLSPCKDVNGNGVAKDGDNDGVADCKDIEKDSKAGAQVDGKGKTISTGFTSPAAPKAGGEATPGQTGQISGLPPVFFSNNSSSISYKNYGALTQVAQFLKANGTAKVIVVGNSDKIGSDEYNNTLAQKRAQSVVDHLVKNNGIAANRLSVKSNGSTNTISTKRNSQQDRRVDFLLSL